MSWKCFDIGWAQMTIHESESWNSFNSILSISHLIEDHWILFNLFFYFKRIRYVNVQLHRSMKFVLNIDFTHFNWFRLLYCKLHKYDILSVYIHIFVWNFFNAQLWIHFTFSQIIKFYCCTTFSFKITGYKWIFYQLFYQFSWVPVTQSTVN